LRTYKPYFYRQRIIGNYIVDFYCPKARLAVEIDGAQHFNTEAADYDRIRSDILSNFGVEVLRFTNTDIDTNLHGVCLRIDDVVKGRTGVNPQSPFG
jgi:very-short-patch-repair endonuclease